MTGEEISLKLYSVFETEPEVEVCLLFGSAAEGKMGVNSDIDVAICGDKAFTHDYLAELQLAIAERLGTEVDLLDMARLNGLILRQVITTGKKILNRNPDLLAHYIKKMLFFSEDMYPNYQMILKAKAKRFAHG
ncbi:MAG: nucleotidyltransferase domain-containing protein [Spirochaetia bacterium]